MLGQSVAVRVGTKALMSAMGADPVSQAVASRVVGWTVAHLTLDHHSQAIAEVADHAHDTYNVAEHFGGYGGCDLDDCQEFVDSNSDNICDNCYHNYDEHY